MPSFLKKINDNKYLIIIPIFTVLILIGIFFLNDIVLSIRMLELQAYLREINREASENDDLEMVSKYKLHFELFKESIDEKKLDEEELKLVYLATSFEVQSRITDTKYRGVYKPVMWIINLLRSILAKPPIKLTIDNQADTELTVAYYFERNRHYGKALKIYANAFKEGKIPENRVPVVLLHQGYCYSLMGEYDKAKSILLSVIKSWENENTALTAALMLQYLEILVSEITKVKESNAPAVAKSEQLYKLIAYKDAMQILDEVDTDNEEEQQKVSYLKARCFEETGKKEESVHIYQEIINNDHTTDMAQLANRRILVMASVDDEVEKLKDLAVKNNELIMDNGFDELLEKSEKVEKQKELLSEDLKESIKAETMETEPPAETIEPVNTDGPSNTVVPADTTHAADTVDTADTANAVDTAGTLNLDEFINNAINAIEEKISLQPDRENTKAVMTATPAATASPIIKKTPTSQKTTRPTKTAKPTIKPTPRPTAVPTPTAGTSVNPSPSAATHTAAPVRTVNSDNSYTVPYKDATGIVYKVENYDPRGNLKNTIIYEYDENGEQIAIKAYDKDGKLIEDF